MIENTPTPGQIGIVIGVMAGLVIIVQGLLSILISWKKLSGRKPAVEDEISQLREAMHEGDLRNQRDIKATQDEVNQRFAQLEKERKENLAELTKELHRIDRNVVAIAVATRAKLPEEIQP